MQGDIRVKSKPSRGSDFIVAFPVRVAQEVAAVASPDDAEAGEIPGADVLRGKSCLLLDDVPENTFIVGEALKRYGIRPTPMQSGIAALAIIKAQSDAFDCIVTDLRMPEMSGQTFIQEVRALERTMKRKRVPIVVMTAESAVDEKRLCLTQYGANEFLLKPVKLRDLVSVLVRIHSASLGDTRRTAKKSILILDDDAMASRFMMSTLARAGHTCDHAVSVSEGVRMLRKHQYDVVILDSLLGDGTGLDFLRLAAEETRDQEVQSKMKVISVSGNAVEEQRRMYEAKGGNNNKFRVDGFLQKPVKKQDVLGLVQII